MKKFNIYQHPTGELQAVKIGWSWPSFFFGVIWLLVARLYWIATGLMAFIFVVSVIIEASGNGENNAVNALFNAVMLVINLMIAAHSNQLREKNLLSRGFDLQGSVTASNKDGAIAEFLNGKHQEADTLSV